MRQKNKTKQNKTKQNKTTTTTTLLQTVSKIETREKAILRVWKSYC